MTAAAPSDRTVTVVLPTYNRAPFLPDAIGSITAQEHQDWQLVVVDDGSTDDTREVLETLLRDVPRPARVIVQRNTGSAGARNAGLDQVSGEYVAFLDSDDLWLPHHLARCVSALEREPAVDWVYGACRIEDAASGRVIEADTFRPQGAPRPFMQLHARRAGDLFVIDDPGVVECQITHGLYSGLQNSVVRRAVFDRHRFWTGLNVGEDEALLIRALASGMRIGYLDAVHAVYRVHDDNLSGASRSPTPERSRRVFGQLLQSLDRVRAETTLSARARRALDERMAYDRFWNLGYAGYWQAGDAAAARACYWRAVRQWPWSVQLWRAFAGSWLRRPPSPDPISPAPPSAPSPS